MICDKTCQHLKVDSYFFVELCSHPETVAAFSTPDAGVDCRRVDCCPVAATRDNATS